jgi:hypothetical protein
MQFIENNYAGRLCQGRAGLRNKSLKFVFSVCYLKREPRPRLKQIQSAVEFWLARELQILLGYSQWRNFEQVMDGIPLPDWV